MEIAIPTPYKILISKLVKPMELVNRERKSLNA